MEQRFSFIDDGEDCPSEERQPWNNPCDWKLNGETLNGYDNCQKCNSYYDNRDGNVGADCVMQASTGICYPANHVRGGLGLDIHNPTEVFYEAKYCPGV